MLLFGSSLIYGFCGGTAFVQISGCAGRRPRDGNRRGLSVWCSWSRVSSSRFLPCRSSAWTPDVYEGAPTPVTAMFAVAPKIAAMSLLVSVLVGPFALVRRSGSRSSSSRQCSMALGARGAAPAEHQAPDGLFVDRQRRLHPAGCRERNRCAGIQAVVFYLAISGHDAGRVRHHP